MRSVGCGEGLRLAPSRGPARPRRACASSLHAAGLHAAGSDGGRAPVYSRLGGRRL